ncbi:MAG: hypothetical protein LBL79_00935 [Prevotella sp.]|nr:hypothetical protein [Prevotella sp.]
MVERVIVVFSSLLTIISSLLTIYMFRRDKGEKKTNKLALLLITVVLAAITVCVLTIPEKGIKDSELQTGMRSKDSLTEKAPPIVNKPKQTDKNEEIVKLVREARRLRGISTTEALNMFKQAYDKLPETQKDEGFIDSMEGYNDFNTQVNLFDNYFKSQNY